MHILVGSLFFVLFFSKKVEISLLLFPQPIHFYLWFKTLNTWIHRWFSFLFCVETFLPPSVLLLSEDQGLAIECLSTFFCYVCIIIFLCIQRRSNLVFLLPYISYTLGLCIQLGFAMQSLHKIELGLGFLLTCARPGYSLPRY